MSDCATVYALAICFGLLDHDQRAKAGARLAEVVAERDYTISTGFAGTPFVTWALSQTGHVDDAYRLLLQDACPSWLYTVSMGATTIWERWDSMLPDGTINPGDMTSFNHYALGAVADWLYKVVAGIQPATPGYDTIRLTPTPGAGLDWANGSPRHPPRAHRMRLAAHRNRLQHLRRRARRSLRRAHRPRWDYHHSHRRSAHRHERPRHVGDAAVLAGRFPDAELHATRGRSVPTGGREG